MKAAIIIDLDGTLCDVSHRVHFVKSAAPDWQGFFDACSDDTPNAAIVALIDMAAQQNIPILFVSGRPETHRTQTEDWLCLHELGDYTELLMRAAGDHRQDAVVKRELYETHIAGRYQILFTVDDRKQVVQMWRDLGLTCFQVAEGDF